MSLYVNKALNVRAQSLSEIEFVIKKGEKEVENHQLLELFEKPNKAFSGKEFFRMYQKYMDIYGEVYILLDKELQIGGKNKVNEMVLLKSDMVDPYFDKKTGELVKIDYKTPEGTTTYPADEIIFARNPSPKNPLRGESLLYAGSGQIDTSIQIDEYHAKILENGGKVEGVFTFKNSLTGNQLTEIKEQYQKEYGNASKAGLPMFLGGDTGYINTGLSPTELSYLQTKQAIFDDMLVMTGVPRVLMSKGSEETFSNADASIRVYQSETVKKMMTSLVDVLSVLVEEGEELTFVDPTPENKEEKRKDIETGIKNYVITPNEAREMLGLEPLTEGDNLLAPMNIMPIEGRNEPQEIEKQKSLTKSPACRQEGETKEECVSRKIPELIKEGYTQDQAIAVANSLCSTVCKISRHPLRSRAKREVYHALCMKRLDKRQEQFEKALRKYFKDQEKRLLDSMIAQKHFRKKDLFEEIFVLGVEIELARRTLMPVLEEMMIEAGEESKEVSGSDWDFLVTATMTAWLSTKVDFFTRQINETTFDILRRELKESLDKGESRKELMDRVKNKYKDFSETRIDTIARTEVHAVTQYGTFQGYQQASLATKVWVWAPGLKGGVRENHVAMDGQEVPINTTFSNGLMFPGDPVGSPSETVNCQCFI